MKKHRYALYVITAGIMWGLIGIFIKNTARFGFDSLNISLIRMIVASISFTVFILLKDKSLLKINIKDIPLFIGTGIVSVALFNFCYFYTIINSEASLAVVLLYTSPVFVVLMSALFFKEKITINKIFALILTFAGCVLVSGISGGTKIKPLILFTGICSGLFYALYSIFGRLALRKYNPVTVTEYTFIFGLIGVSIVSHPIKTFELISANPQSIIWCIGIGIVSTVLPYFFYTKGLEKLETGKAAILVAVEPLVGALIGMTVLKESRGILKIAGIILIIISIIILNINSRKGDPKNESQAMPVNDVC